MSEYRTTGLQSQDTANFKVYNLQTLPKSIKPIEMMDGGSSDTNFKTSSQPEITEGNKEQGTFPSRSQKFGVLCLTDGARTGEFTCEAPAPFLTAF